MLKKPVIATIAKVPPAWNGAADQFESRDAVTGTVRPADCFSTSNYPLSPGTMFRLALGDDT